MATPSIEYYWYPEYELHLFLAVVTHKSTIMENPLPKQDGGTKIPQLASNHFEIDFAIVFFLFIFILFYFIFLKYNYLLVCICMFGLYIY